MVKYPVFFITGSCQLSVNRKNIHTHKGMDKWVTDTQPGVAVADLLQNNETDRQTDRHVD